MNIYANKGYKVVVKESFLDSEYNYDREKIKKYLEVGKIYYVDYTVVHSSSTDVYLCGFPNVRFNSSSFKGISKQTKEIDRLHDDWYRYN